LVGGRLEVEEPAMTRKTLGRNMYSRKDVVKTVPWRKGDTENSRKSGGRELNATSVSTNRSKSILSRIKRQ